jgi:hypothetical protein
MVLALRRFGASFFGTLEKILEEGFAQHQKFARVGANLSGASCRLRSLRAQAEALEQEQRKSATVTSRNALLQRFPTNFSRPRGGRLQPDDC